MPQLKICDSKPLTNYYQEVGENGKLTRVGTRELLVVNFNRSFILCLVVKVAR